MTAVIFKENVVLNKDSTLINCCWHSS